MKGLFHIVGGFTLGVGIGVSNDQDSGAQYTQDSIQYTSATVFARYYF